MQVDIQAFFFFFPDSYTFCLCVAHNDNNEGVNYFQHPEPLLNQHLVDG